MKIIHGTWIPKKEEGFFQEGAFYLWAEDTDKKYRKPPKKKVHPGTLTANELEIFLCDELGIKDWQRYYIKAHISPKYFLLPSHDEAPVPSPEVMKYLGLDAAEEYELTQWEISCFEITNVIKLLNDIHFLSLHYSTEIQLGMDLLFWYQYTRFLKNIIYKDHYIPALKYHKSGKGNGFEIYPTWEIVSENYNSEIKTHSFCMPSVCTAGFEALNDKLEFYSKESLLRHFSETILYEIVTGTPFTGQFDRLIEGTLIADCVYPYRRGENLIPLKKEKALEEYQKWALWREKLTGAYFEAGFNLCFQLIEAPAAEPDRWQIYFLASSKKDPSYKMALADYWHRDEKSKKEILKNFGKDFEKQLLLNLGYAARIYPKVWDGLETDKPGGLKLNLDEAFGFLKEIAWILEDAGYKIIIPSWWTPAGRRKAKIRLKTSTSSTKTVGTGYFSLHSIVKYQYSLSIGGENVTEDEWKELVNAKTPLVNFRGAWVELDRDKMKQMLEFWQSHSQEKPEINLLDMMKMASQQEEEIEFEHDEALSDMMEKLHDRSRLDIIEDPSQFNGTLREYQKRGVSWLKYLESLGLSPCLADDMGLGKTIQVIARMIDEREGNGHCMPTLLIAPTSVLGNWLKEIERFAPHLKAVIHHGINRVKDEDVFQKQCVDNDVVITSFSLARKDEKLFQIVNWQRIVVDEAQNIKNPKAAQTRAVLKLKAVHRVALTGTPIENRLLDLWSIFNFLNPGYLGKEAQFRKSFEVPIQKENDFVKSTTLKKLVEPFILRRVKTDKDIIKDLPDKVEQKLFCNLTKEQASLYEAVVKDVSEAIENTEGIKRKGLILSTLLKLKQICNHPAQFLHDGSEFTESRSHKLKRLTEMMEEVIDNESLLIFTQFREIGDALNNYLKKNLHYNTFYIHGGTTRNKREQMIAEFQDPDIEPSVFVLSLKAGGVGITLTKANHVFHFDRWWNPAVEDQATDRAFRIGQKKNVFVHKFISIGTLEERIDAMIEDKKKLSSSIIGTDESWLTELDNNAFKKLIALNKEAILEEV